MTEDLRLARIGQNDELMTEIAADRSGICAHRNRLQAHAVERPQIGDEHPVIGFARLFLVDIERIGILHQELAGTHRSEARPDLITELQLDMIEVQRQIAIRPHIAAEDVGDHFLIGRTVKHRPVLPVCYAQHLLAVIVVATTFLPEFGRLNCRHQNLDGARAVLLFADYRVDLLQYAFAQRQPGVDAGRLLADHPRSQHQPMGDDFRFLGVFFQNRQEVAGQAHFYIR